MSYKCALRIGHKIREHMAAVDGNEMLDGDVEVDEPHVGGYEKGGQRGKGKAVVLGMAEKNGDVHTTVVPNRRSKILIPEIVKSVEVGSEIHTDEHVGYQILSKTDDEECVGLCGQTTNTIEGFFLQLKRTIEGTHIWVSP